MRFRIAIPDRLVTKEALEALAEATMHADEQAIRRGEIPDVRDAIARYGVKWQPERFLDGEHFDLGHEVLRRRWGDCDDLGPYLAASLRASGEDPNARPHAYLSDARAGRWHMVTETSDGDILDPSKWAGMGKRSSPSSRGVVGSTTNVFAHEGRGSLCVLPDPSAGIWRARADVPMSDSDAHLASHGYARTPDKALDFAISGMLSCCGEEVDSSSLERLRDAGSMLLTDVEQLIDGDAEVGSFWKKLVKGVKHVAKGPLGYVANPAMAFAGHTLHDKKFAGVPIANARSQILSNVPGGQMIQRGSSMLSSLTHGQGSAKAPGAVKSNRQGVSVNIPHHKLVHRGGSDEHPITVYYHPANSIGPVIARF